MVSHWILVPFGASPDLRSDDDTEDIPEELTQSESSEDSKIPDKPAARKALFPSSMGLSFLVSGSTETVKTTVNWGDYLPEELDPEKAYEEDTPEKSKRKKKPEAWKRIAQQAMLTVPIEAKPDTDAIDIPGGSGLKLVVTCRAVRDDRFPPDTKSISVFLVNYRAPIKGDRDLTYAFQTSLCIQCAEGFTPRTDPRAVSTDDWDEAVAALQYREEYEFAVGHNVSATAQAVDGSHCTEVCTTWIPTAEVPRVAPAIISDVKLGMEALAEAPSAAIIRDALTPLVTEYRTWIAAQRAVPVPPSATDTARALLDRANKACDRMEAGLNALDDPQVLETFRITNRAIAVGRRRQVSQERNQPPASVAPPNGDRFSWLLFCSTWSV